MGSTLLKAFKIELALLHPQSERGRTVLEVLQDKGPLQPILREVGRVLGGVCELLQGAPHYSAHCSLRNFRITGTR